MACPISSPHLIFLGDRNLSLRHEFLTGANRLHSKASICLGRGCWQREGRLLHKMRIACYADESKRANNDTAADGIQLYSQIERLVTEASRQSQSGWGVSGDWTEIEGAWVLRPKSIRPTMIVHFVGGIFVGAAPQLTYRYFLECLAEKYMAFLYPISLVV